MKNKLKIIGTVVVATLVTLFIQSFSTIECTEQGIALHKEITSTDPACLQVYYYIEQYADSFDIPKKYAYGVANAETGYNGPFHWKYNHKQTSSSKAYGPMQILLSTARYVNGDEVSAKKLKNDVEYNIKTSMKYLRMLHDKYGDWKKVFGYYNTGYPRVNEYARKVCNYEPDWAGSITSK
jgi:soluble lytic murein transglycosylase-like protein